MLCSANKRRHLNDAHSKKEWVDLEICQQVPQDVLTHIFSFFDEAKRLTLENHPILKHIEVFAIKSFIAIDLSMQRDLFDDSFFVKNLQRSMHVVFDCTKIPDSISSLRADHKVKRFRTHSFEFLNYNLQDANVYSLLDNVMKKPCNIIDKFYALNHLSQIRKIVFTQSSVFELPNMSLDTIEFVACRLSLNKSSNIFSNIKSKSLVIKDCYPGNMFAPSFCDSVEHLTIDCSSTVSLISFSIFWNFLENFKNIQTLRIFDCLLYGDWNALIQEYVESNTSFPFVKELDVSSNTQFFVNSLWTHHFQKVFPNVEKIAMTNCNLTQADVGPLQEWISRCKFQDVNLDENPGIQVLPSFCFENIKSFSANQCTFPVANFLNDCIKYLNCPLKNLKICIRNPDEFWKTWNVLTRQNGRVNHITMNLKDCNSLQKLQQDIQKIRLLSCGPYENADPVHLVIIMPVLYSYFIKTEFETFFRECFPSTQSTLCITDSKV